MFASHPGRQRGPRRWIWTSHVMYTCNVQYKVEPRCDAALASKLSTGIEYFAAMYAIDMHRVSEDMMLACTCAMAWRFAVRAREVAGGRELERFWKDGSTRCMMFW